MDSGTGNYTLNKLISDDFNKGDPGKVTVLAGELVLVNHILQVVILLKAHKNRVFLLSLLTVRMH